MKCFHCKLDYDPNNYPRCPRCGAPHRRPQRRPQRHQQVAYPPGNDYLDEPVPTKKKNTLSLIALIIGALALIFVITSIGGLSQSSNTAEEIGTAIGLAIVMPSVVCLGVGVLLNLIGYLTVSKGTTLASAIFYTLSLILFFAWGFVAIPSMILQYVAHAKMKKS